GASMPAGAAEAEEELAHAEVLELFQAALARLVQDPLLCDLPPQGPGPGPGPGPGRRRAARPHLHRLAVAGQGSGPAPCRSTKWFSPRKYIWRTYHLTYAGEKLADDRKKLREYGIRNRDEVSFIKKLRK
ncbi:SNR25 protein, partial [Stercorarius parasiticus]|nr:SNR25 protein [Stercorarius parasiticus]